MMIRSKDPVPTKYTGANGEYVTAQDVRGWCAPRAMISVGKLSYPPGNVALRLPKDLVGIDVDAHSGKAGGAVLAEAEKRWGRLPPTWKATSRLGSPQSGIRLYRVPEGLAWPGGLNKIAQELGFERTGGIELIRWDHRYMMVAPSTNPDANGAPYVWVSPDGEVITLPWGEHLESIRRQVTEARQLIDSMDGTADSGTLAESRLLDFDLPSPDECADMPESWVTGLTEGRSWAGAELAGEEVSIEDLKAWVADRDSRPVGGAYVSGVCPAMDRTIGKHILAIRRAGDDGGAHDAALEGAWAVMGDAAEGHYGVERALVRLKEAFLEAVKDRRGNGADGVRRARGEWTRMVRRGASKIISEYTNDDGSTEFADEDLCASVATQARSGRGDASGSDGDAHTATGGGANAGGATGSSVGGDPPRRGRRKAGSAAFDFERNDRGNAQRLLRHTAGEAVWCGPLGGWHLYDNGEGLWKPDLEAIQMTAEMMDVCDGMREEAAFIENEKHQVEFLKFVSGSANIGKLESAIKAMRALKGVNVEGERFDLNMNLLHCKDVTVELTMQGVTTRPTRREDWFRLTTGINYRAGATHELWDKFLDRFLPDPEVRKWAQKLAGYSLQGENPARVLVVCKGKTSTGKTTFAEAIRTALGGYASTFNLSLFRASQDERPRVDVIEALPKRLVMAEEVSSAWHLHADQVKRATGNGMWEARGLYGKGYINRVPSFTPWIATNNTPTIEGADAALMRRLRNIPFLEQVSQAEEDGLYKAKLRQPEVLEAILAWAITGWELWLDDEPLTDMPASVLGQLAELGDEINDFAEMVAECFNRDPACTSTFESLWSRYETWALEHSVPERERLSKNKFGRKLTEMGFQNETAWVPDIAKMAKVRRGISLKLTEDSKS